MKRIDLASQTAWTAGDADIASSSMRIGETAKRAGFGCVAIASTGARFRHDEGTALRDGNGSLKDDLDRRCMQARGTADSADSRRLIPIRFTYDTKEQRKALYKAG